MTPKAFTSEARAAIDAQSGPIFEAIVNAYIAANIDDTEDPDELDGEDDDESDRELDPYSHVPALLKNFANPFVVHLVYAFYAARLPTHVSVGGQRVRILEPEETLNDRSSAFGSFNLVFGGKQGWIEHAMKYHELSHDRQELERLAVRWLEGDWHNAEFFRACERVPGFDRQLRAVTISEHGEWGSDEDMLHLAGYKQLKAQYAREGGNPEEMDHLMRAFLSGDEARYHQLRRRFEPKQRLVWPVLIVIVALVVAALLALGYVKAAGYLVFLSVCVFGAPLITILLLPILGPILLIAWTPFRLALRTNQAASMGIVGGIFAGVTLFLVAWGVHKVFGSSANWLTGLGCAIQVFAAPKVWNARYAIPTSIIVFFVMSLFLLP